MYQRLFCFNIVGLSPDYLDRLTRMPCFSGLLQNGQKTDLEPVFPCLTLPAQASISTGTSPAEHGIVANGFYERSRFEVSFWDQYRSLVQAETLWEKMKQVRPDFKSALLFCQNSLYADADIVITPKPMHTDDGLVQWCYSKPPGLYETICKDVGRPFNLMDYWGPFASEKGSEWIMDAAVEVLRQHQPDFMMTYLPHLDYSCQKLGPGHASIEKDLEKADQLIGQFMTALEQQGLADQSAVCVFSEYSLSEVNGAVLINQVLRRENLLSVREIEGREYLDFELSRAFAMVDHQVAHVYVQNPEDIDRVKILLESLEGIDNVFGDAEKKQFQVDHERSGELIAVSDRDKWFAYYWWLDPEKAPDFAEHVDIHRKPGYDPVELFMDTETFKIPQDTSLIKGSHGAPPATGGNRGEAMAAFLLSGSRAPGIDLPPRMKTVEIAPLLIKLMGGHV